MNSLEVIFKDKIKFEPYKVFEVNNKKNIYTTNIGGIYEIDENVMHVLNEDGKTLDEIYNNLSTKLKKDDIDKILNNMIDLKILRLNALEIDKVFANEIDNIYLNFSDQWPKLRHNKRRLTSKIFLEKYEHIFKTNITKTIELRTDNEELFIYSLETLSTAGYHLSNITFDLNATTPERITTEYEDKFSERGNKIYYLKASK